MSLPDLSALPLDPYWEPFRDLNTHQDFIALADDVAFRPEVPADVVGRFEVARLALVFSAVNALMIDAAVDRTLLSLELALVRRHEELGSPLGFKKRSLYQLIEWGGTVPLFEDGPDSVHGVRSLRNELAAHPDRNTNLRMLGLGLVREVPALINDLYDDAPLRQERQRTQGELQHLLDAGRGWTASLQALGYTDVVPLFTVDCIYVENRYDPSHPVAYVLAWPIATAKAVNSAVEFPAPLLWPVHAWSQTQHNVNLLVTRGAQGDSQPIQLVPANGADSPLATWRQQIDAGPLDHASVTKMVRSHGAAARAALRRGEAPTLYAPILQHLASVSIPAGGTATVRWVPGEEPTVSVSPAGVRQES